MSERTFESLSAELREGKLYKESDAMRTLVEENLAVWRNLYLEGQRENLIASIRSTLSTVRDDAPAVMEAERKGEWKKRPSELAVRGYIYATYGPDRFIGGAELRQVFTQSANPVELPELPPWDVIDKHMELGHILRLRLSDMVLSDRSVPMNILSMQTFAAAESPSVRIEPTIFPGTNSSREEYTNIATPSCRWVFTQPTANEGGSGGDYIQQTNALIDFVDRVYAAEQEPDSVTQGRDYWEGMRRSLSALSWDEAGAVESAQAMYRAINRSNLNIYRPSAVDLVQDFLVDLSFASEERKRELIAEPPYFSASFGSDYYPIVVDASEENGRYKIEFSRKEYTYDPPLSSRYEVPWTADETKVE